MAAVTAGVSATTTTDNTALTTGSFTPALNDLLVAFAVVTGQAAGGTFTDSQSLGWTQIGMALMNGSADALVCAVANKLAAASGTTVTFTPAGAPTSTGVAISVLRVSGMNRFGAAAIKQTFTPQVATQQNQATTTTPKPAFVPAVTTTNPTLGAVANATNPAAPTVPTGWTQQHSIGYATPTTGLQTVSRDSGFTGTTITWGGTSASAFCDLIIELDASGAVPFLSGWKARLPLTFTSGNAAGLSFFQVACNITGGTYTTVNAKANADRSDLRVTGPDGTTLLNFWLEDNSVALASTIMLLIKPGQIPANGASSGYLYYGNAGASAVSSAANTIKSQNAPSDVTIVNQTTNTSAYAGGIGFPCVVRLQYQTGGNAANNGKLICVGYGAGSPPNGGGSLNSVIWKAVSTNSGTSWTVTTILTPTSGSDAYPVGLTELTDGTLVIVYFNDVDANTNNGNGLWYVAKSTDSGATWTNLSATPSNALPSVFTSEHTGYGPIIQRPNGDLWFNWYGFNTGDTGWTSKILRCASGADYTSGANWAFYHNIIADPASTNIWAESAILGTNGDNNVIAITRQDTVGDLYISRSTDNGVTWSAQTALGFYTGSAPTPGDSRMVSPFLLRLANGDIFLIFGDRNGSQQGALCVVSTDNGTTWGAFGQVTSNSDTGQHNGYPTACQLANGNIVCATQIWHGSGNLLDTVSDVIDEDWACNPNAFYDSYEGSVHTGWTLGAGSSTDSVQHHSGTQSLLIDNSANAASFAQYAPLPTDSDLAINQGCINYWVRPHQIDAAFDFDGELIDAGTNSRIYPQLQGTATPPFLARWEDSGAAFHSYSPSFSCSLNTWAKYTQFWTGGAGAVSGVGQWNNVDTASVTQSGAGTGPITQFYFQTGNNGGGTTNSTVNVDDVYLTQYALVVPLVSFGAEQLAPQVPWTWVPTLGPILAQ